MGKLIFPYENTETIVELYNGKVNDVGNRWFITTAQFILIIKIRDLANKMPMLLKNMDQKWTDQKSRIRMVTARLQPMIVCCWVVIYRISGRIDQPFWYKGFDPACFYMQYWPEIVSFFHRDNNALAGRYEQIKLIIGLQTTNQRISSSEEQPGIPGIQFSLIYFDGSFVKLRNINLDIHIT